ncbi:MAG TPA: hypothetical protein VFV38_50120 [Ktedonobacteraceae bacterium]|nr:hypothetical protein [Ktedonobacteraceae bacterium]
MSTAPPPFSMNHEQAQRLVSYIQTYRRYAWEYQAPSRERNELIRLLQTVQGKLMSSMDQRNEYIWLPLAVAETAALQTMVNDLFALYGMEPASDDRNRTIADLILLKNYLKRTLACR